jgi:hypothetical protein
VEDLATSLGEEAPEGGIDLIRQPDPKAQLLI